MTRRDLGWRIAGAALFAAACTTNLEGGGHAFYSGGVIGLMGFGLASLGMVMIIQGGRLRDVWKAELRRLDDKRDHGTRQGAGDAAEAGSQR